MAYLLNDTQRKAGFLLKSTFEREPKKAEQEVCEIADRLLNPEVEGDNNEFDIDWIKQLIAGDVTFDEFCQTVRNYDDSPLCGCVWTAQFVAYRCKTCATSPCMSICAGCFERGNHEGHDYNIFRSEAGGACDCGDASVMMKEGFCSRHGPNRIVPDAIPQRHIGVGKLFIRHLILTLIHLLRSNGKDVLVRTSSPLPVKGRLDGLLDLLLELLKLGSPIREFVSQFIRDEKVYQDFNQNFPNSILISETMKKFHRTSFAWFCDSVRHLQTPEVPNEFKITDRPEVWTRYSCYLYELMFWTIRYEFHENLILFLLNLLSDGDCKEEFARTFVRHYTRIAPSLISLHNVEPLSNRVVHISVQLFSNEELAYKLCQEENLLQVLLTSLHFVVQNNLEVSQTNEADYHQCVCAYSRGVKNNSYWPIVSDLVNVLGHHRVALKFLGNENLLSVWMQLLTYFSGMDLIERQFLEHTMYEPQHMLLAFYCERETCATPLWCLLDAMKDPGTRALSSRFIDLCLESTIELLDALGDPKKIELPFNQISFHYPLHRYLALFVSNAVNKQGLKLEELDISEDIARRIISHPIQMLATTEEIQSGMWVRNGQNVSTQILAYKQSFFCTFFIDADIYMLQLCSRFMSSDIFISSIFDRCRTTCSLSIVDKQTPLVGQAAKGQPDDTQEKTMLESTLYILTVILSNHTHQDMSEKDIIENELMALLVQQTSTHSNLCENIPQCHDLHAGDKSKRYMEPLNHAINKLAKVVEGDPMAQTKFELRSESWKKYDPIFTRHRVLYKRFTQQAHNHYLNHLMQTKIIESTENNGSIWSPYKVIRIRQGTYGYMDKLLNCRSLHTVIFMIVYKYLKGHTVVTEQTLSLAMVLLEACVYASPNDIASGTPPHTSASSYPSSDNLGDFLKFDPKSWFATENMANNIHHVINRVQVKKPRPIIEVFTRQPSSSSDEDSMHTCGDQTPPLVDSPQSYHSQETHYDTVSFDLMEVEEIATTEPEVGTSHEEENNVEEDIANVSDEVLEEFQEVNESILTMLLKLHAKITGAESSFTFPNIMPSHVEQPVPLTCVSMIKKILIMAAIKSSRALQILRDYCEAHGAKSSTESSANTVEAERLRRKAQAKRIQEKMKKMIEMKSKRFLEKMEAEMSADSTLNDSADSIDAASNNSDTDEFSCIICRGSEHSLEVMETRDVTENPVQQLMCEIVLVQSSNVLGNRLSNDQKKHPIKPNSSIRELDTCHRNMMTKESLTEKCFPIPPSNHHKFFNDNFDWDKAPHVSSCGHHVHFTCHKNYLKWVRQGSAIPSPFHDFGFPCPLCRQTSTHVLPCNSKQRSNSSKLRTIDYSNCDDVTKKETQLKRLCAEMYERIEDATNRVRNENENSATIIQGITQELHWHWTAPGIVTDAEHMHISILRGNLEYDLLQRDGTLVPHQRSLQIMPKAPRKLPISSLFHMLCQNTTITHEILEVGSILWSKLYNPLSNDGEGNIPILCKDPVELVLKFCCVVYPVTMVEFKLIVRIVYIVAVVQSLVQVACKFTNTERRAWKSYASVSLGGVSLGGFDAQKLECLLGYVISCLPQTLFSSEERESSLECLTTTVYSTQSVNCCVQEQLLHYLRITSLLQHHVFNVELPSMRDNTNEFVQLSNYLDLSDDLNSDLVTGSILWPNTPRIMIQSWCKELSNLMEDLHRRNTGLSNRYINLLTSQITWSAPRLIDLPDSYNVIFQKYRQTHCADCRDVSREPALCLVCGRFVCFHGKCAREENGLPSTNSVSRHLKTCGNGTCILLIANHAIIKVIRGKRICDWGTLYLDQHGEEDKDWKRGKPLYLRRERLDMLTAQWRCHMFDDSHRFWLHIRD